MVYAFIFSGLGGKTIILDLPTLRLSGPFRHVELLGEVSLEGILRNVQLAVPFALAILVFGTLSLLLSESFLSNLSSKAPYGKKVLTSIGIYLSSRISDAVYAREGNTN